MVESSREEKNIKETQQRQIKISPSILSVPLADIEKKIKLVENNIDYIHIDVMDGKFVTNKTHGVEMFKISQASSNKPLDVHLMVENPIEEIDKYKGAEIITFHIEAVENDKVDKVIDKIKSVDAKVGVSVKPDTSIRVLTKYFNKIDLILVMTVEPGYGGQALIEKTLSKVKELRELGFEKIIQVDGGITLDNVEKVKKTDINIIVAGTAVFSAEDENKAILKIKE